METLKGIGAMIAGLAIMAAFFFVLMLIFSGVAYVSVIVMPWLVAAAKWAFAIALFILLPTAFFKATRPFSALGFLFASFAFGLCAWVMGFLLAYSHWGLFGVIVGIVLGGVGVVPVGLLAAMFHGEWYAVWILLEYVALTIGSRIIMAVLAAKADRDEMERNIITLEAN